MASIHRSQLRLHQITGSLNNVQAAQANLNAPSMQLVLDHLASGIHNIAGQNFHNITDSTLKDGAGNDRITFVKDAKLLLSGGGVGVDSVDIHSLVGGILLDVDATGKKIHLDSEGSVDIDGNSGIAIDSSGGTIAIGADVNTGAVNIGTGGEREVTISSATGAAGITLVTGTGGIDIDAQGDITIDAGTTSAVSIQGSAASDFTTSAGDLTVKASAARVILSGSSAADSVHVQSDATFDGAVVITGDLTINGATTTVSTQNLNVEDALIMLQAEQTGGSTTDMGIIMERGTAGDNAALIWDEGADKFLFGTTTETGADADVTVSVGTVQVGKLEIDGADDHIDVSTDLTITAVADIKLTPGGGQVVPGSNNAVGLGITNTAEFADLFLGDGAEIGFLNNTVKLTHVKGGHGALRMSTTSSMEFNDAAEGVRSNASRLVLRSNARDYLFPDTAFLQNGVLTDVDGNGTLEFRDASADTQKIASGIFSAIASGSAPGSYTLLDKPIGFVDPLFLVSSQLPAGDISKRLDVFVNGQMLLSGSGPEVGSGTADYVIRHPTVATIVVTKSVRNSAASDGGNLSLTCGANAAGGGFNNNTGLTVAIAQNDTQSQIATKILTQLRDSGGSGGGLTADQCFIPAAALDTVVFLNRANLGTLAVVQTDIIYADASSDGMTLTQNAARVSPQMAFDLEVDDTVSILVR